MVTKLQTACGGREREVDWSAAGTLVGLAGKLAEWDGRQVTLRRHVTQTLGWGHGHCDGPCDDREAWKLPWACVLD